MTPSSYHRKKPTKCNVNKEAITVMSAVHNSTNSYYYGNQSYNEWCNDGKMLLLRFQEVQRQRTEIVQVQQRYKKENRYRKEKPIIRKKKTQYHVDTNPKSTNKVDDSMASVSSRPPLTVTTKKHDRTTPMQDLTNNNKLNEDSSTRHSHDTVPSLKNTAVVPVVAETLFSSSRPLSSESITLPNSPDLSTSPMCTQLDNQSVMETNDDDNDNGGDILMDDECVETIHPTDMTTTGNMNMPNEVLPIPRISTSPSSSLLLTKKDKNIGLFKKKIKTKHVYKARTSIGAASKTHNNEGIMSFIVKDTPPQSLALIEGICTTTNNNNTDHSSAEGISSSYYTSQRYHYLLDIVDHEQYQRLPTTGYSVELPSTIPVASGKWTVQILASRDNNNNSIETFVLSTNETNTLFRSRQSDWNGYSIRLIHTDYIQQVPINNVGSSISRQHSVNNNISMERIDPYRYRMANILSPMNDSGNVNDGDDELQMKNYFVGAMGVAIFDGFASTTESHELNVPLATTILQHLHQVMNCKDDTVQHSSDHLPTPMIPTFTAGKQGSMDHVSGSGGIVIPVNIGCHSQTTLDNIHDKNDYHLMLYTSEEINHVVAIDVVFEEINLTRPNKKICLESTSSTSSPSMDQIRSPKLTIQNLEKHTSKWSAVNVIKQLWKKNNHPTAETNVTAIDGITNPATTLDDVPFDKGKENMSFEDNGDVLMMPITTNGTTSESNACNLHHTDSNSTPQDHVDSFGKTLISFSSVTIDNALVKTDNRKPLQNHMMNKVTPTPQVVTSPYNCGDLKLFSTNTMGNTETLEQKILFPENVQDTPDNAQNVNTSSPTPFVDNNNMGQSSTSTEKVNNDNIEAALFPRLSTTDTNMAESIHPIPNLCDDHVVNLLLPVINEDNAASIDAATRLPLQDILFFELQNADWVPEMSANDVLTWFEEQSVLTMQNLDNNRTMYLQHAPLDRLPAIPVVFDLDDNDDDTNTSPNSVWIQNWVIPMLTLITTTSVVFYLFGDDLMYFFLDSMNAESVTNFISNDPSQHLLARMFFVGTDFGYFGAVSLD